MPTPLPRADRRVAVAALVDVVVIITFTGIGRRNHEEGLGVVGWAHTAWPFLVGLALGWALVALAGRTWPTALGHGVPVWVTTLVGGMLLRALSDQGTALPFVVVASLVLAAGLIGWRLLARLLDRPRS